MRTTRRAFLRGSIATGSAVLLATPGLGQAKARVVVLGGGFAGASCARELQRADPRFAVTLVEENLIYRACPFSNSVIAGLRDIAAQRFGYETLRAAGIAVVHDRASSVDPQSRRRLHSGFSDGSGWRSRPWTRDRGGSPAATAEAIGALVGAATAEAIGALVGAATVQRGKVKLELPPIVENGNTVALNVSVESPMTEADHVEGIHIFNEKNPQPYVAAFHFGPRAGKAAVSTRIRLADSQQVVAIARLSDGSFWSDGADVIVTLAACAEG